jgi:hypothetical protein
LSRSGLIPFLLFLFELYPGLGYLSRPLSGRTSPRWWQAQLDGDPWLLSIPLLVVWLLPFGGGVVFFGTLPLSRRDLQGFREPRAGGPPFPRSPFSAGRGFSSTRGGQELFLVRLPPFARPRFLLFAPKRIRKNFLKFLKKFFF